MILAERIGIGLSTASLVDFASLDMKLGND